MQKSALLTSLKKKGFSTQITKAFEKVPREKFISKNLKEYAYYDEALPLEKGATISQPYTIAFMLSLLELKKGEKILEIGSGSGYVLALLNEITNGKIYGVEIIKTLADDSRESLKGYKNICVINKSGFNGLKEKAPFDKILASAAFEKIPSHLFSQLKENGILVCPVNSSIFQFKKIKNKIVTKEFSGFAFVRMQN